jgi:Tfp pilus assembly protein PilN
MRAVNLLPDAHRRVRSAGSKNGAYLVVGVLAVLLVMAALYTLTSNQVNSKKTEAAEARQEAERLEARALALSQFGNFAQIKRTRAESVRQLADGRFDWERMLRELSAVLPAGSWLQEVSASTAGQPDEGGTGGGAPASAGATAATAKPSLSLIGCMPRQGEVAKFMVRLRQMYLVEDVELNESAQDEAGGPPTLDNCGRYYKFDLVVIFSSASPTGREAPQGSNSVPARLGGGS